MSERRAKRHTKPPKKYEESEEEAPRKGKKYVLRLLASTDITQNLKGKELYLLWPDDGVWYPAEIQKVDVSSQRADVVYLTTDEEENISLSEVVAEKSIAFREARPKNHRLREDEILDKEERPEASKSISGGSKHQDEEETTGQEDVSAEEEVSAQEETSAHEDISAQEESEAMEEAESSAADSKDDEIPLGPRKSLGNRPESEDESGDSAERKPKKRRRVFKAGDEQQMPGVRPKRQITLSNKAQELMSAERQAQLEAILQRRQSSGDQRQLTSPLEPAKDEFSTAEEYEQKLLSQLSGSGGMTKASPGRRPGHMRTQVSASDGDVREKAVEQITAALEKVTQEMVDVEDGLPDAKLTAEGVEEALFALYGEVGKDYKAKYRSLIFNLRDAANPDLRRRVLLAEIPPDKLVRFSANELASKQLSQWREEKEKEAMKAAVLDTQAAAKFSTAAALASKQSGQGARVDWRDNTLATASPPRDQSRHRGISPELADEGNPSEREAADEHHNSAASAAPELAGRGSIDGSGLQKVDSVRSNDSDKGLPPELPSMSSIDSKSKATKTGSAFNWSSIRATALQEWDNSTPPAADRGDAAGEEEYQPDESLLQTEREGGESNFGIAESSGVREQVWHGVLGNACPVPLPITIEYVAGTPAMPTILPSRQMDVKGRVQLDKAEEFMRSLKTSRSRILSLGLMRLTTDASEDEKAHLSDMIKQYIAKDRCGVLPLGETELYFVAASKLASGLLKACVETHGLAELPTDSVLLVFVHRKNLTKLESKPPREPRAASKSPAGRHREKHRKHSAQAPSPKPHVTSPGPPKPSPGPEQASAANTKSNAAPQQAVDLRASDQGAGNAGEAKKSQAPQPQAPQPQALPVQLPQGLDLNSLGSLAAVLGVSQGLDFSFQGPPVQQARPTGGQPLPQASQMLPPQQPSMPLQLPGSFPGPQQQHPTGLPHPPQQQQQRPPMQWGPQPGQHQQQQYGLPPPPRFRPQLQAPGVQQTPPHMHQRPPGQLGGPQAGLHQQPHGPYQQQQVFHQQQQQAAQGGGPRPVTLPPPPGPRPITLQPPGPPGWRGHNRG